MLLLAGLAWAPLALADDKETEETQVIEKTEAADADDGGFWSRFSGVIQADFSNAYYFRGILQEKDGVVAEPWGELYFNLFSSEDFFIRDVTIGGGVWASFQTENTGASDSPNSLYETDWYPLLSMELPAGVSLTTIYYFYTSPNDAFKTVQEWNLKLAWDDSEVLGKFSLQPWMNLAVETKRTSFGPDKGEGMQFGVGPTLYELPCGDYPVTFTLPLELGIAINDYYEQADGDETTFGYFSWGLKASMPLAFMPTELGAWSIGLTGKGYVFSNRLQAFNDGDALAPQVIGSIGMEF
jgi:hypothetical protein